jgi:hypothetical protein
VAGAPDLPRARTTQEWLAPSSATSRLYSLTHARRRRAGVGSPRAEHEITRLITLVAAIANRMGIEKSHGPELWELAQDVAPERVMEEMEDNERRIAAEGSR